MLNIEQSVNQNPTYLELASTTTGSNNKSNLVFSDLSQEISSYRSENNKVSRTLLITSTFITVAIVVAAIVLLVLASKSGCFTHPDIVTDYQVTMFCSSVLTTISTPFAIMATILLGTKEVLRRKAMAKFASNMSQAEYVKVVVKALESCDTRLKKLEEEIKALTPPETHLEKSKLEATGSYDSYRGKVEAEKKMQQQKKDTEALEIKSQQHTEELAIRSALDKIFTENNMSEFLSKKIEL